MSGIYRSSNPSFNIKPRGFFVKRLELLNREKQSHSNKKKFDPNWNKQKTI